MMDRVFIWYWGWYANSLAEAFEEGLTEDRPGWPSVGDSLEVIALTALFPLGAFALLWETGVRGRDVGYYRSRLRAYSEGGDDA